MPEAKSDVGEMEEVVLPIVTLTLSEVVQLFGVQLAAFAFKVPALHDKVMEP